MDRRPPHLYTPPHHYRLTIYTYTCIYIVAVAVAPARPPPPPPLPTTPPPHPSKTYTQETGEENNLAAVISGPGRMWSESGLEDQVRAVNHRPAAKPPRPRRRRRRPPPPHSPTAHHSRRRRAHAIYIAPPPPPPPPPLTGRAFIHKNIPTTLSGSAASAVRAYRRPIHSVYTSAHLHTRTRSVS